MENNPENPGLYGEFIEVFAFRREFCLQLQMIAWHLGNRQLMIASQDLLWWLGAHEAEASRHPVKEVSGNRAPASTYRYLFLKLPEPGERLFCSESAVDYIESIPLEHRLELARYVKNLPVRLFF